MEIARIADRCVFCHPAWHQGGADAPWNSIVEQRDDFVIVPTKGALIPGWLLVVSKQHFLCSGALSPTEWQRFEIGIHAAERLVRDHFGPATVFEHGPARAGTALGCGIDHLHVHVAPLPFSLTAATDQFLGERSDWSQLFSQEALRELHESGNGYGWVKEPADAGLGVHFLPPPGVRQIFRQAIADRVGTPYRFDYASFPNAANVEATLTRLRSGASQQGR